MIFLLDGHILATYIMTYMKKIEKCNNSETFQKLCFLSILKRFTHLKYYKSATIEHIEKFFLS